MVKHILILGSSEAGKTVPARTLAQHFNLPLIHLDHYFWRPGWVQPSDEQWRQELEELVKTDAWVMEGLVNNLELRAEAADMIIPIILPRWLCLWRMLKRYWAHRGKFREDAAPGCPEKLRWHFIK
jgi:adenylate kinase family enzyme